MTPGDAVLRGRILIRKAVATIVLGMGLAWAAPPAAVMAHAGEDHTQPAPPRAGESLGPRVVAQSEDFELVAVAQGRVLTIYLDRFGNNAPVDGAKLDIDVNGKTFSAAAVGNGTYRLAEDWIALSGRYDLIFTVMAADKSDLLSGTLEVRPAATPAGGGAGTANGFLRLGDGSLASYGLVFFLGMLAMLMVTRTKGANAGAAGTAAGRRRAVPLAGGIVERLRGAGDELAGRIGSLAGRKRPAGRAGARTTTLAYALIGLLVVVIALVLVGRGVAARLTGEPAEGAAATPPAGTAAATTAGNAAAAENPHRRLDGTVFLPKSSQRLLDVTTAVTRVGEVASTIRVAGHVIADPGTSGQIHSSIKGRLQPAKDTWPRIGQKVTAGEVLAWVVPIINPIDRNIIDQQLAMIDREIGVVQEHIKRLMAKGATPTAKQLDDARYDLANLSRRRMAIATVLRDRDTLRAPLFAPADGVIAASFAVAGQLVDEQQKLFEVVNLKRLWVEAYAYDITTLGDVTGANAISSIGRNYKLEFISRGPQLHHQTIPLYFKIDDPDSSLSVGSIVSVLVNTAGRRDGVILPSAAVVMSTAGQSIVWQHESPESFAPVAVRVEPIDGDQLLVVSGLKPNVRVVKTSADLLTQFR